MKMTEKQVRLVLQYRHLVAKAVRNISYATINKYGRDEIESWGMDGLIEAAAIDKEHPNFQALASVCIIRSIIDELRRRTKKKFTQRILQARQELANKYKREPSVDEIQEYTGIPIRYVERVLNMKHIEILVPHPHIIDSLPTSETQEDSNNILERIFLERTLSKLSSKEKRIVELYYYGGYTNAEIGKIMSISESGAAQIRLSAIQKMRKIME